jgi:diguanylate cyclase (GGDEF)-like protein
MSTDLSIEAPTAGPDRHAELFARLWPQAGAPLGAMAAVKDAATGRYEWVDPALARWLACSPADLVGHTDADWSDPATATALRAADQAAMARSGVLASEHRFDADGQRRDALVLRLLGPPDGQGARALVSVWVDQQPARQKEAQLRQALEQIEQLQRANDALRRELKDQGLRDHDSGLYTRGHFEEQLRREVDLSTREHREFALVFIEIDPAAGKAAALGDAAQARILEAMGRLLRDNTRAMDASCRFDDRRFAVLLSGVGLATAHARMEGLRRQCATQIVVLGGQELGFSVSMGVASFPHTAHSQDELMGACEAALGEAKRRGGNHVTLAAIRFDPS